MENSNETSPTIAMKEPDSAERGYRDSRRSLVEEGGAPKGVSSLSHFARQHVEPWRADWRRDQAGRRCGERADVQWCERWFLRSAVVVVWWWSGGRGGGV